MVKGRTYRVSLPFARYTLRLPVWAEAQEQKDDRCDGLSRYR